VVAPWKYLDAWKAGKDLSPGKAVAKAKAKISNLKDNK
jgi:hypothetical protein